MKKLIMKGFFLAVLSVFLISINCMADSSGFKKYNAEQISGTTNVNFILSHSNITDKTKSFYIQYYFNDYALNKPVEEIKDDLYIVIKNRYTLLAKKKYSDAHYNKMVIDNQKANSVLRIFMVYKNQKICESKLVTVKPLGELVPERIDINIQKPNIKRNLDGSFAIRANKGDTVLIRNSGGIVRRIKYMSTATKNIHINIVGKKEDHYIYSVRNGKRSYLYTLEKGIAIPA